MEKFWLKNSIFLIIFYFFLGQCTEDLDVIPFPGDCHKYFMCLAKEGGGYDLQEFTCGDWVFDPNIDACTDPNLPSNDMLCPTP